MLPVFKITIYNKIIDDSVQNPILMFWRSKFFRFNVGSTDFIKFYLSQLLLKIGWTQDVCVRIEAAKNYFNINKYTLGIFVSK